MGEGGSCTLAADVASEKSAVQVSVCTVRALRAKTPTQATPKRKRNDATQATPKPFPAVKPRRGVLCNIIFRLLLHPLSTHIHP